MGLQINLEFDPSAMAAPEYVRDDARAAAGILEATFSNNITVNITVSYDDSGGASTGGPSQSTLISYSTLRTDLMNAAASPDAESAAASLPDTSTYEGQSSFLVSSAQEKALGLIAGDGASVDGAITLSSAFPAGNILIGAALHEMTHTLGRVNGSSLDMFRYASDGSGPLLVTDSAAGPASYFSINGGVTDLAGFSTTSDTGDFVSSLDDPFDAVVSSNVPENLTPVDVAVMDALGFSQVLSPTPVATLQNLAALDNDAYSTAPAGNSSWTPVAEKTDGLFQAVAYTNASQTQIVLAIGGTDRGNTASWAALNDVFNELDSGSSSSPTLAFSTEVSDGAALLAQVASEYPGVRITISGNSLGGAVAQLIGEASGDDTITFNAPGAQQLYSNLSNQLAPATQLNKANTPGSVVNYRTMGDAVSYIGTHSGQVFTIDSTAAPEPDLAAYFVQNDSLSGAMIPELQDPNMQILPAYVELRPSIPAVADVSYGTPMATGNNSSAAQFNFANAVQNDAANWIGQNLGTQFTFSVSSGPAGALYTLTFPDDPDVTQYAVSQEVSSSGGEVWEPVQDVAAETSLDLYSNAVGFKYDALSSTGGTVTLPQGFMFDLNFASIGAVAATLTSVNTAATDTNDVSGGGTSNILWQNEDGQAAVWTTNGLIQTAASWIGGNPGPSWQVVGVGDFYDSGQPDIVWQNTDGQVAIWTMNGLNQSGGSWVGTSGPGPDWPVVGTGDFDGSGRDDILLQNTQTGQAEIWMMDGTSILEAATVGTAPGPQWKIAGVGDFNGDGKDDILWQNTTNGQASIWTMDGITQIGSYYVGSAPGSSWRIAGTGYFTNNGQDDILWQNSDGQAAIWTMNGVTQTGGTWVGSNPGPSWQVVGAGDYSGNGNSDILWQNTNGQVAIWTMSGTNQTGANWIGANPGSDWHIIASPS